MTNSLVTHLKAYLQRLFLDIRWVYTKPSDWERDLSRLIHELEHRGSRVLTLDFPALGKHLDKCLSEEMYSPSSLPYGRLQSRMVKVPVFCRNLYLQIFSPSGKLRDNPSVDALCALRCVLLSLKKLRLDCHIERTRDEVVNFITCEQGIRIPSYSWDEDTPCFGTVRLHYGDGTRSNRGGDPSLFADALPSLDEPPSIWLNTLQQVCDRVSSSLGDLSLERPTELPKHGPGVVSNLRKGTSKYQFPEWPAKLDATFPHDLYARTDFGYGQDHDCSSLSVSLNESPSRLISVPKTQKGPRLIAAEPVQHQWIQQLVRNQLEARISHTPISSSVCFRSQIPNQERAIRASIDGGSATIDLSSASDRLSCWTIERAFRSNLTVLNRLHACRTRWLANRIPDTRHFNMKLRKFAPMGSAVTFPVQTIVYASVAVAAVLISQGKRVSTASIRGASHLVQVFGDDMVVPTPALGVTVRLLEYLGLKVNNEKTFGSGYFRESCGVDAFKGFRVDPPYLLDSRTDVPTDALPTLIEVSNNFYKKGYWHVASWLMTLPNKISKLIPIVGSDSGTLGFCSYQGADLSHLKTRWNDKLHRDEVRIFTPVSTVEKLPTPGSYRLFQWFIEKPLPETRWVSGTNGRPVVSMRPGWVDSSNL